VPACRARAEKAAVQVDRVHVAPALARQVSCRHARADPGIVDQDVDPAVPVHDQVDHGVHRGLLGHIEPVRFAAPDLLGHRTRCLLIHVAHRNVCARLCQRMRARATDASAAPRDQRHPAVQPQQPEIVSHLRAPC
jgi:hypothetical protein